MGLILPQKTKVKWNPQNKRHFESKGYSFTAFNEEFEANVLDLLPGAENKIYVTCDFCNSEPYLVFYNNFNRQSVNGSITKTACYKCRRHKNNKHWLQKAENKLNKMQEIAELRGGKCLSERYTNAHELMLWECGAGHVWSASAQSIKIGETWCFICNKGERLTKELLLNTVNEKQGECLSNDIGGWHQLLLFKCALGHTFDRTPSQILHEGRWCKICIPKIVGTTPFSLQDIDLVAEERGGKLITREYKKNNIKLIWECANGHQFSKILNQIRRGEWCPVCTNGKWIWENKTRYILETLFNYYFFKDRTVLNGLELDGYNQELKLAFEYQGEQHTRINFFTSTEKKLAERKKIDSKKRQMCEQLNIKLLVVPFEAATSDKGLLSFVVHMLSDWGYDFKEKLETFPFKRFYETDSRIEEIEKIAAAKGGRLITREYFDNRHRLEFECKKGHRFFRSANKVKSRNDWCDICSGHKYDLSVMQEFADHFNGQCLSSNYVSMKDPLEWACARGHVFFKKPARVIMGRWCDTCGGYWEPVGFTWNGMYDRLAAFKLVHGNCNVPWRHSEYRYLGYWIKHQRTEYKNGTLSNARIELLTSLGLSL